MRGNVESDDEIVYQSDDQTTDETTVSETGSSSENSESDSSEQDNSQTVTRFKSKATNSEPSNTSDNLASGESNDYDSESEETEDNEEEQHSSMYQKILTHKVNNDETYFFVKVTGQSYRKCIWITKEELISTKSGTTLFNRYWRKYQNSPPQEPYYDPEYEKPEKIITQRVNENGNTEYLVKWKNLDYDMLTWENQNELGNNDLINNFIEMENNVPNEQESNIHPDPSEYCKIKNHQKSKHGLEVRYYQLDGLNFLVKNWFENRNVILADEMGLGKTLQSTLLLNYLSENQGIHGPFLVIAPLSTLPHWEREIKEWTNLTTLTFCGTQIKRKIQKKYEFFYQNTSIPKFNVLITTYEYIIREEQFLSKINWKVMIIDETHRLKNHKSKILNSIKLFDQVEFKLLITGTPLQNNIEELWTLLNLLDPNKFDSIDDFKERFGDLSEADQVTELQDLIKPYMIRRRKNEVEKSLPPMEEIIIECPMTQHQKAYYKNIYNKNLEYLSRGAHKTNMANLNNISMELRKVCNHPYLINGAEEQILVERCAMMNYDKDKIEDYEFVNQSLIRSAGKMILLDKLLNKLKKDGHRVLIFSQMKKVLDILQDYLTYKEYGFERIDGGIRGEERQKAIDRFNEPDSKDFVFLLCTKAGGVGINLTSADTVIIYDSDWNPQNDIQATARCHRIGQLKEVKVYRFITSKSYERKMFDRASMKLGLDHAVLESGKNEINTEDMEKLLRFGAYYAFEDDEEENNFNEEDIETVLSHSMTIRHENVVGGEGSTFSKAQFTIDEDDIDISAPDFWQKYKPEVVEDDIEDSGASIAERRKILREESNSSLSQENSQKRKDNSNFTWSKGKISSLQTRLYRYGWGRWKLICEKGKFQCEIGEVRAVCHVILKWLIDSSEDKYPILELIYNTSVNPDYAKFEKKFIKKYSEDFGPLISNGSSWKLNRLEIMHFLINYVSTCPNPPEGLILPELTGTTPAEWWTKDDDKILLYSAWEKGFLQYDDIHFSKDEPINQKYLTLRIRSIVNGLKSIYVKYKQFVGAELPFNFDTIQESLSSWNRKEHRAVVRNLILFGYPGPEKFKEITENYLSTKSEEQIDKYVQKIINTCNELKENKEYEQSEIFEKIMPGTAQKLLFRVEIFSKLREIYDNNLYPEEEKELVEYFAINGFSKLNTSQIITDKFGTEGIEGKSIKYIRSIISKVKRKTELNSKKERQDSKPSVVNYDEDGSIIFPINISQTIRILSLGKIVNKRLFCSSRYIYPDGFVSERLYTSLKNPNERVWYTNKIIDIGEDSPRFRVELSDDPSIYFEANSPTNPWVSILKEIEKQRKILGIQKTKSLSISGPESYGLNNPTTIKLIQDLEGAKELLNSNLLENDDNKTKSKRKSRGKKKKETESESDNEIDYETESIKESQSNYITIPQRSSNEQHQNINIEYTPTENNNPNIPQMNHIELISKQNEMQNMMVRYPAPITHIPQQIHPIYVQQYLYQPVNQYNPNEVQNQYNQYQYIPQNQIQNEQQNLYCLYKK